MTNSLLTPDIIAKEGLMQLENSLVLGNKVHADYSKEFAMNGETISIDRPIRFHGQSDNLDVSSYNEDIIMGKDTITMDQTETVKFKVTAKERTLDLDALSKKLIQPAIAVLRDRIETEIAALYTNLYHFSGTPGTIPGTFKSLGTPGAIMTDQAVPTDDRFAVHGTEAGLELADGLKGVYVQDKAKTALERATVGFYAGFDNFVSVHAPTHVVGALGGTPLVNGGSQGVTYLASKDQKTSSLITDGWSNSVTGLLKKGDIFTIANVFSVNPNSLQSTGRLQTFSVMADANSSGGGAATLTISPAIIPATETIANGKAYATVTAAPADNAAITVKTGSAGGSYKQSLLLHPNAFSLVSRPLDIPSSEGVQTSTAQGNRMTIACTKSVDFNTLDENFRFDILFKATCLDERLGVRLTS